MSCQDDAEQKPALETFVRLVADRGVVPNSEDIERFVGEPNDKKYSF